MSQVQTQADPVEVDPKHYSVEVENEKVRVLRIKYPPHEKSEMHWHPDSVAVAVTDFKTRFTFPDGTTEDIEGKAGEALWISATTHLPENPADEPFEVILVEVKR
jgi:quercetin dioxygenase-like cupin family protein